jgi:hypothetical protein
VTKREHAVEIKSARFSFKIFLENILKIKNSRPDPPPLFFRLSMLELDAYPSPKPLTAGCPGSRTPLQRAAAPGGPPSPPRPRHHRRNYGLVPSIPHDPAPPSRARRRQPLPTPRGQRRPPNQLSPSPRTAAWLPLRLVFLLLRAA